MVCLAFFISCACFLRRGPQSSPCCHPRRRSIICLSLEEELASSLGFESDQWLVASHETNGHTFVTLSLASSQMLSIWTSFLEKTNKIKMMEIWLLCWDGAVEPGTLVRIDLGVQSWNQKHYRNMDLKADIRTAVHGLVNGFCGELSCCQRHC